MLNQDLKAVHVTALSGYREATHDLPPLVPLNMHPGMPMHNCSSLRAAQHVHASSSTVSHLSNVGRESSNDLMYWHPTVTDRLFANGTPTFIELKLE